MDYPKCPYLYPATPRRTCRIIAGHTNNLSGPVVPAMCQATCQLQNGPYCGREVGNEAELKFAAKIFVCDHRTEIESLKDKLPDEIKPHVDAEVKRLMTLKPDCNQC